MTENLVPNGTEVFGDEKLNEQAMLTIRRRKGPSEVIHACAGFAFGTKVMAVTDQRVRICNNRGNTEFLLTYESISDAVADGRTLVITTSEGIKQRCRMSRVDVALELADSIRSSRWTSRREQRLHELASSLRQYYWAQHLRGDVGPILFGIAYAEELERLQDSGFDVNRVLCELAGRAESYAEDIQRGRYMARYGMRRPASGV